MTAGEDYLEKCRGLVEAVASQQEAIARTADLFSKTIIDGKLVHLFGSGHSRIPAEEMWPRYGSFPGFHPIVELSLTYHNQVVGANGQRQAMFLENVTGLAEKILRNFDISEQDSALVISSSGCNVVPVEMAQCFQERGLKVVAILGRQHMDACDSRHPDGKKLADFADIVLDTGIPPGDSMTRVEGLGEPVCRTFGSGAPRSYAPGTGVDARLSARRLPGPRDAALGRYDPTERPPETPRAGPESPRPRPRRRAPQDQPTRGRRR